MNTVVGGRGTPSGHTWCAKHTSSCIDKRRSWLTISHVTPRAAGPRDCCSCSAATAVNDNSRHPILTRTIVADIRREPNGQNVHNSGAKKLKVVVVHDRVVDRHGDRSPIWATSKPLKDRSCSAKRAVRLTNFPFPTKTWLFGGDSPKICGTRL